MNATEPVSAQRRQVPLTGRLILGGVLVLTAAYALSADIGSLHLFNPDWHPHARFHLAQMLAMLTVNLGLGLFLLLRRSVEPMVGASAAAIIVLSFWLSILWVTLLIPGSDLRAGLGIPLPRIGGVNIYVNVVAALAATTLTVWGWRKSRAPMS